MEWKQIITTIISASFIVALIEFFIKQSYVKLLDKKIEEAKEDIRRRSKVYDMQFDTYLLISGLVYRARNTARDIKLQFENSIHLTPEITNDLASRLMSYNHAIIELLYEKRAILSREIFIYIHELKNLIPFLVRLSERTSRKNRINEKDYVNKEMMNEFQDIYNKIDNLYNLINEFIQNEIKVR